MATLTFYGAVEGVTGSLYLLETESSRVLLECGLFQGRREEERANQEPFPFDVATLDAVVLSHAHLDHSGRLPLLVKQGYANDIFMTAATCDLIDVLLNDAAGLQERDAQWENNRRRRAGKEEVEPLYTLADVEETLGYCRGLDYHHRQNVAPGVDVRFCDAGHILGSAIVEIFVTNEGADKKLVFSGDLGNSQAALLRDPELVDAADVLLLESTYGDREHRSMEETLQEFEEVIQTASKNGGNILIPSFAVGRTQEIIFRLGELYQRGLLRHQAVYLDSPMAIAATEIYHRHQNIYNHEDKAAIENNAKVSLSARKTLHSFLPILRYSTTTEESMALNKIEKGAIIIAGSGMCNGGRIRHHLKHNLWRQQSHVIFVGFQAVGTPGRTLVDGAKVFKVVGEEIVVRASIHTLGGFSAHASQSQLTAWLANFAKARPRFYLVHGEEEAKQALRATVHQSGWQAEVPGFGEQVQF